jgi:hypothetical protein
VNGIKEKYTDQLSIISVDVQSPLGQELSREYGSFTPTFIFFNDQGEELWRMVGSIDPNQVRRSLQEP